jgi:hypothetical protein
MPKGMFASEKGESAGMGIMLRVVMLWVGDQHEDSQDYLSSIGALLYRDVKSGPAIRNQRIKDAHEEVNQVSEIFTYLILRILCGAKLVERSTVLCTFLSLFKCSPPSGLLL